MYVTLNQVKQHLIIDQDFKDDDTYLVSLIEASEDAVEKHLGYKLSECLVDGRLPKSIQQAILLMVGNFYLQRESISINSINEVPLSYTYLLNLQKNWMTP